MVGRETAEAALARIEPGSEGEATVTERDLALTRFAGSMIHQNLAEHDATLRVRVRRDARTGVAVTNRLDAAGIEEVVARAAAIARHATPEADPPPFANETGSDSDLGWVEATAEADPRERAEGARAVIDAGVARDLTVSGAYSIEAQRMTVANSTGLASSNGVTQAKLVTVMIGPAGETGYAQAIDTDLRAIDPHAVGSEAADRTARAAEPGDLGPGEYPVVLGEYAVAEVLEYLAFMAFSGLALEEGRACVELGQPAFGPNVTIWDDGLDTTGIPSTIDFEGVPKRRVALVTDGVARETVHDGATAYRAGVPRTGHGLPAPNTFGPLCWNLFMAPGDTARDRLLDGIDRGLLITRFHYVNIVHPKKGILTGMTRDGTFLIEDGAVAGPVRNLRFTQSIPDAFSRISAIAAETRLVGAEYTGIASRVPAIRIDGWNFTGVTANEATV
ncbi:MAG TPA: metallopeptidase TldD-related protein [Candidatus Limnocylindria bacterium]|nr:metallopeptidase TldD-related protein [Candidatus Limnocylindria bacterium]